MRHLEEHEVDALPFGLLELDSTGVVRRYNRAEEALTGRDRHAVIGRSFFSEVAPCTAVETFGGRYKEMVRADQTTHESFDFVFNFPF